MIILFATIAALMFALLFFQTRQGPLDACYWLLLRLRAASILVQLTARHVAWWMPAHWPEAMADARKEPMVVEVNRPRNERQQVEEAE